MNTRTDIGTSPGAGAVAPAIRVHGLEKSYKDPQVLKGVDLEVARGSIFALLGSNGAGKTTAIRILATLLKADGGSASVNGYDVATQAEAGEVVEADDDGLDQPFVDLLDALPAESPGGRQILALLEERGWKGWTRIEQVPPRQS